MTLEGYIESDRHEVWTKLYSKLDLNPGSPLVGGRARVLMAIRPTIDVDSLLRKPDLQRATVEQNASTISYFTVDDGEEWYFIGYSIVRAAGDRNVIKVSLAESGEDGGSSMTIDEFAAISTRTFMFPRPLRLRQAWQIRLQGTGGTTNGDWTMNIFIEVDRVGPS